MGYADLVGLIDKAASDHLGGVAVTYRPEAGAPVDVIGIFDANYVLATGTAEAGVETIVPVVFLSKQEHDKLPIEPEDDEPTVTVGGVDYRVYERQPDGMGGLVLVLRSLT